MTPKTDEEILALWNRHSALPDHWAEPPKFNLICFKSAIREAEAPLLAEIEKLVIIISDRNFEILELNRKLKRYRALELTQEQIDQLFEGE